MVPKLTIKVIESLHRALPSSTTSSSTSTASSRSSSSRRWRRRLRRLRDYSHLTSTKFPDFQIPLPVVVTFKITQLNSTIIYQSITPSYPSIANVECESSSRESTPPTLSCTASCSGRSTMTSRWAIREWRTPSSRSRNSWRGRLLGGGGNCRN